MNNTIYYKTGSDIIDMIVGGNKGVFGFPCGKFINIVGDKSAGKTFLSNEIIASAYHTFPKGEFKWVYDDCEAGYSFDTYNMYGFSIMPENEEDEVHSTTVEEAFCHISDFANSLKKDQCGIYVLDSLDSLTSDEQDEQAEERLKAYHNDKTYDKGSYNMGKQKYLSKEFFPQLCSLIQDKNILVIIISQVRENINTFSFEKYKRAGGKALDFYAHSVLWLVTCKKIEKKDRAVGVCVKAKTTKSKTPRPYREGFFTFLYDYGLDNTGSDVDYLYNLRTDGGDLSKSANAIRWENGNEKIGLVELKKFLEENEAFENYSNSKYFDGKADAESITEFICSKKALLKAYNEKYGNTMTRDELIAYIEDNNLQAELTAKVIAKWEEVEDSIKSNRKRKYATQPIGE